MPNHGTSEYLRDEIVAQGYDLSINRYKEVVQENAEHRPPAQIVDELELIEAEIQQRMSELKGMIG